METGTLAVGINEAAEMVSVSPDTIRRLIKRGTLNASRISNRVVIPMEALRELVQKNQNKKETA